MKRIRSAFQDPRDYQILFLGIFFITGVAFRDFSVHPANVLAVLIATLGTQFLFDQGNIPNRSLRSAWITGISLCLLLRANSPWTMVLAGAAGILSKFIFRYRGKHFFNPSNFAVVVALLLTKDAWITPGQWGQDAWLIFLFAGTGSMVVRKVGRWDTTGAFLIAFASFEAMRNYWLGWTWDVWLHKLTSGSMLLFAFFMITDPRAIPDDRRARVLWAIAVAALTYVLRNRYFITTAPFWALFVLSPLTILFDRIWPALRFQWRLSPAPQRAPVDETIVPAAVS